MTGNRGKDKLYVLVPLLTFFFLLFDQGTPHFPFALVLPNALTEAEERLPDFEEDGFDPEVKRSIQLPFDELRIQRILKRGTYTQES